MTEWNIKLKSSFCPYKNSSGECNHPRQKVISGKCRRNICPIRIRKTNKRPTIKELKKMAIEEFKKRNNLKKYDIIEVEGEKHLGRIKYFYYNEDRDEPCASLKFEDEIGSWVLGRKSYIYQEDLDKGIARKVLVDHCVHFFEESEPTGKYKDVLTLGGIDNREVYKYKCKFCGKEVLYP